MFELKYNHNGILLPAINVDYFENIEKRGLRNTVFKIDFRNADVFESNVSHAYNEVCNLLIKRFPQFDFKTNGVTFNDSTESTIRGNKILEVDLQIYW